MSEIPPTDDSRLVSRENFQELLADAKLTIPESEHNDFRVLLSALDEAAKHLLQLDDEQPTVDLELYPRINIHIPDGKDTDKGGWATKVTVVCTKPKNSLLAGRTVALKDNIALAGVRCLNGTPPVGDAWIPTVDATVATRVLDAGATILGKAACENGCFGGVSDTACTGPVDNPWAPGYSTGGSSSGSGRLVASGQVDLALGCDQGGSIRLPAAHCGLVGHKPTWGLVPYTGILSLEATIDHVGPMTKTVADCALLMDVLAGYDGMDDRVPRMVKHGSLGFVKGIEATLGKKEKPLEGLKVGILKEGFESSRMDPGVEKLVRAAAAKFEAYGATVTTCSIPLHTESAPTWMCALPMAGMRQGILGDMTGRKQLFMTNRIQKTDGLLSQAAFDAYGPGGQNTFLRGRFLQKKYGPALHARALNLMRRLTDEYDKAFAEFDLLVMPTAPMLTQKTMTREQKVAEEAGPLRLLNRNLGVTHNTAPFDFSGHPALSLPIGFASPADDPGVKLPVGMQLVGRQYEDLVCLQAAAVWERENDWQTIYAGDL
ncbi:hypothetical protein SBRCBS47491_008249 [Sporothrix bragantina]|uniref:Amidase domain-containing protein n=1 Tax=Sporothrix bragantina TaxID=671064 RepID=A0ABP0CJW2_9PEZI